MINAGELIKSHFLIQQKNISVSCLTSKINDVSVPKLNHNIWEITYIYFYKTYFPC